MIDREKAAVRASSVGHLIRAPSATFALTSHRVGPWTSPVLAPWPSSIYQGPYELTIVPYGICLF
jgi:hypothetical protein